jgi:hypothetical protein
MHNEDKIKLKQGHLGASQFGSLYADWFAPALYEDHTVAQSLAAVNKQLQVKLDFVRALAGKLCGDSRLDSISLLISNCRRIEASLDGRIDVLRPEREADWFKVAEHAMEGPFTVASIKHPIMPKYSIWDHQKLKDQILDCWAKAEAEISSFSGPSLWHELLALNSQWNRINAIEFDGSNYKLETNPEELPDSLKSPVFLGFMRNVQKRLNEAHLHLERLFGRLMSSSEQLWKYQESRLQRQNSEFNEKPTSNPDPLAQHFRAAKKMREEFRKRRQVQRPTQQINATLRSALKFMGFDKMPEPEGLKRKYRIMARTLHPDCNNGEDSEFKQLAESYRVLTACVTSTK